ncbi:hypothetical protein POM88_021851 [Heracleum sosnowskyi]|uniref:NB-ARC domain-containing protein n=1 Tax=Heracleum sosnowskyi TaxID=360622 RepID=A0AAD8IFP0_9APIA|nr:hypothetical protein POM88_021851 [Heracleum sosnowskyi]
MIHRWITFSQFYHKRDLLLRILRYVVDVTDDVCKKNNDILANVWYSALVGQRYIIVVDGIWSSEAYDDFKTCFPDESNGSKILLTTRLKDIVVHAQSEARRGKF